MFYLLDSVGFMRTHGTTGRRLQPFGKTLQYALNPHANSRESASEKKPMKGGELWGVQNPTTTRDKKNKAWTGQRETA